MATITRSEFVQRNQDKAFDVTQATQGMRADVARRVRAADADGDGQIRGAQELGKAFTALDTLDRDGSLHSMKLDDIRGRALPTAQHLRAFEAAQTSAPPRRGLGRGDRTREADSTAPAEGPVSGPVSGDVKGVAKGTGYYPHNSKLEGGYNDMRGKPLHTLQSFLKGDSPYVSIALDKNLYRSGAIKYGDTFRIPELEAKYGRPIVFKAVDTGGAFTNKGFGRVDICTGSYRDSIDPTVNSRLTLVRQ